MTKFNHVKISEVGRVVTGKTPPTSDETNYGYDFMFIGPTDLHKHFIISNSEKMISQKGLNSIKGSIIDQLSILVGCIGWDMGNVAIVDKKCATNQQINSITEIKPQFNPYFIYYWLSGKKAYLFSQANVTRTPILNKTNFSQIEIPVPPRKQQDKIAKTLSLLDEKIDLNNRINAELEGMAKLLYDYWFVQFDFPMTAEQAAAHGDPTLTGKPYKSSGGKMTHNKTLNREIPEGWDGSTVEDVLAKEKRTIKIPASEIKDAGAIPVIDQSAKFICGFTDNEDALIESFPKIIFGDHTRALKFINFTFARGADGTQVISSNDKRLPPHLFYHLLDKIDLSSYGYARHFKFLKGTAITIPTELLATKFESAATPWFDLLRNNQKQNQELASLRDWLLPMLMNGQVTVKK